MRKDEMKPLTEDDLLVYARYAKVAYNLQKSNNTQLTYKGAAITLMLATFIGIGYSSSTYEVNLPYNSLLVVVSICFASLLILGSIWYLDLIVEEKKIAKTVHNGLALEERYQMLPNAYHNVVKMNYLLGYVSKKSMFYLAWASILILTICTSSTIYLVQENYEFWWTTLLVSIGIIPLMFFISNWITKKTDPYPILDKLSTLKGTDGNRK